MRIGIGKVTLAWLATVATLASPISAQTAAIAATVTDSTSAAPLSGARVEVTAAGDVIQTSITTRRGGAELTDLAAGVYTLSVSRIGYRPERPEWRGPDPKTAWR